MSIGDVLQVLRFIAEIICLLFLTLLWQLSFETTLEACIRFFRTQIFRKIVHQQQIDFGNQYDSRDR